MCGSEIQFINVELVVTLSTIAALLGSVRSSVILANEYNDLERYGNTLMHFLIHDDNSVADNEMPYSWSYSWSSTNPAITVDIENNKIRSMLNQGSHYRPPIPQPPMRIGSSDHMKYRGWVKEGHRWNGRFEGCENGRRQSPIDIDSSTLKIVKHQYPPLKFEGFWNLPDSITLANNEDTIQLNFEMPKDVKPTISGGPLKGEYLFWQIHFHWGSRNSQGSEHTVDKISYPMEMHVVFYKKEYGSPMNALNFKDGLTVVGYFFEISDVENNGIASIVKDLEGISSGAKHSSKSEMSELISLGDLATKFSREYITYKGSLTTPQCSEIVTWIISGEVENISQNQLDAFRSVLTQEGPLVDNFRETQPLNGRVIEYVL